MQGEQGEKGLEGGSRCLSLTAKVPQMHNLVYVAYLALETFPPVPQNDNPRMSKATGRGKNQGWGGKRSTRSVFHGGSGLGIG